MISERDFFAGKLLRE